ncbi:tRNA (adenosine(37)-N6)-threonylcarbamoyltransferase complex dimerization subunit type 1 TsaB [Cellulomonas chitinilytica]|uniref:tRNA (Adenosine(37)-N6)-threonylcarbamoyltransferase complex dimerization subunit type 1 TsaB n=1 Tax=Cellulomonas chitinilytica TaxID=398759 RepID=A0A919U0S8_9CELL|nr:tRNA (adenosine(37)-N6)-threonylcarbamoyltransferase complex dimerization subunit type 1 TsaB [Cellulomonas chitinilytica]GIG19449.1 tRNA (adenosine(37)-N6)-threonylcarbamoyltransferase complex dimerization subunit type 1 TsaB [Cellulomonas chitinilytica]
MPVLALDTSSSVAVAVLGDDGTVLAARSDDQPRHHAELLAPMVEAALAEAGVDRAALTAVVVGTGPAPFTGLRVGLVTARTLGLALGIPVHGVPSLDAVAATASRTLPAGADVLVATDARRREVYWALYRVHGPGDVQVVVAPEVASPADVAADPRTGGALVVGRGAALYPALAADGALDLDVDPAELARLALARAAAGQVLDTEPLYLRRPDAVPSAGGKRVLG